LTNEKFTFFAFIFRGMMSVKKYTTGNPSFPRKLYAGFAGHEKKTLAEEKKIFVRVDTFAAQETE